MSCKNLSRDNCLPPNCKYINGPKRKYCRNTINTINKTKKVSQCKGLAKNNCFQPCKYVDTQKRQYCRISGRKNVDKVEKATKTIRRFMSKTISNKRVRQVTPRVSTPMPSLISSSTPRVSLSLSEKKLKRSRQIEKVNKAKNTIGNFLYKNREKIRANFLKMVCSDSGVCIAFGKESKKINDFFKFFDNFDYMTNYTILNNGGNGTVASVYDPGGGGGGAGGAGGGAGGNTGGSGGGGLTSSFDGTSTLYGRGGAGVNGSNSGTGANTGNGGTYAGSGGSGIVMVRYLV